MKTRTMILCALFAALTAVGAFFKIPFALAAISLQFLFTAMAGVLLGAGYGALSQAVYDIFSVAERVQRCKGHATCILCGRYLTPAVVLVSYHYLIAAVN